MNVLVIGSGGREHAICRTLKRSPKVDDLFCADGNPGIARVAQCVPIRPDDIESLAEFAETHSIGLTFVGGESPLALGIVDMFESRGLKIVGPSREAAKLEASKSIAKDFMARQGIPTAKFVTSHSPAFAVLELESGNFGAPEVPVVVKADGLAAGKGVVVAGSRSEAIAAINEMDTLVGAAAADKIILEECLFGKEVSLLMFANGEEFALMPPVRDHKRIGDGDTGPNTGGMGTITGNSLLTADELRVIEDTIIRPSLRGCVREGFPFRGILFLGLMMTAGGPKLLEYNVRFGDPETQAILVRLETDLVDICEAMLGNDENHISSSSTDAPGSRDLQTLATLDIRWRPGASACVVLAAEGYPGKPRIGDAISGLDKAAAVENVEIFHAGTATAGPLAVDGDLTLSTPCVTHGGRVLGVTATGTDLSSALASAYTAAAKISWPGMQMRKDIGK